MVSADLDEPNGLFLHCRDSVLCYVTINPRVQEIEQSFDKNAIRIALVSLFCLFYDALYHPFKIFKQLLMPSVKCLCNVV